MQRQGLGNLKGILRASLFPFTETSHSFCLWRVARRARALLMPFSMDTTFAVSILAAPSAPYNRSWLIEMGGSPIFISECAVPSRLLMYCRSRLAALDGCLSALRLCSKCMWRRGICVALHGVVMEAGLPRRLQRVDSIPSA